MSTLAINRNHSHGSTCRACVHWEMTWHDFWCQVAIFTLLVRFKEEIDLEHGESTPAGFYEWIIESEYDV